ncbi:dUTP diphosphatase [Sphingomonas psychrotolerans]|uniref:dUTP diphosphatase n=1 Tax=Sphingomonas psychrotolerans TaxID=1327635 RepID=A0ABU3N5R9_9SPHN|nr:dUTP diphosphatase [Sphingomonas psychrotolerans]MDT8759743.1 dUTP diphosphatase [Sphingomonas psychrotolerans]
MIDPTPAVEMRVLDPRVHEWGLPRYHTDLSAGIDMYACIDAPLALEPGAKAVLIPSGVAFLMGHNNMAALLLARSGMGHKKGLVLSQAVGTIDADYTAELFMSIWLRPGAEPLTIEPGDRIAQLVFLPILRPALSVVDDFSRETARGAGGFGSTGTR